MEDKVNESTFEVDLNHLEAHLIDKYDIYVSFHYNEPSGCCEEESVITINSRQTIENQLYTLLHEAGHYVLYQEFPYEAMFPSIIRQPFKKRFSKANAVSVMSNEVMAWEIGRQLANMLGITVDPVKWNKMKNKSLYDYMRWGTGRL